MKVPAVVSGFPRSRRARVVAAVVFLIGSGSGVVVSSGTVAWASLAQLQPAGGQFVGVPVVRVLDTRFGTGGVPVQPIQAGATLTFPVAGVFGIPSNAESVVLNLSALNSTVTGFLAVYDTDSSDPGLATVGMRPNHFTNQNVTVPVSLTGTVSVTNHSSGTTDVAASVVGYYAAASTSAAGDTYFPVPWSSIANTSTGWKVPPPGSKAI